MQVCMYKFLCRLVFYISANNNAVYATFFYLYTCTHRYKTAMGGSALFDNSNVTLCGPQSYIISRTYLCMCLMHLLSRTQYHRDKSVKKHHLGAVSKLIMNWELFNNIQPDGSTRIVCPWLNQIFACACGLGLNYQLLLRHNEIQTHINRKQMIQHWERLYDFFMN